MRSRRLVPFLPVLLLSALAVYAQIAAPASPTGELAKSAGLDLAKWEPEIAAFEAADRQSPPPPGGIVFAGSSSIRRWTSLREDFPGLPVLNRGFGGSQIREVTAFADRIITPYHPRLIVFYCGNNDVVAGRTVPEVVDDFKAFVAKMHAALPETRLVYVSNAPNPARWQLRQSWLDLNARIRAFTETDSRLTFVDVWPAMLGPEGQPRPELFVEDQLHMNERGYAIWAGILRPVVARVFKLARTDVPTPH